MEQIESRSRKKQPTVMMRPYSLSCELYRIPIRHPAEIDSFLVFKAFLGQFAVHHTEFKLYTCGGFDQTLQPQGDFTSCDEQGILTVLASMIMPRESASLTGFKSFMIVSGGCYFAPIKTVERFNVTNNSWRLIAGMEIERRDYSSVLLNGAFLYLVDQNELTMLNIESHSSSWNSISVKKIEDFTYRQISVARWENRVLVFGWKDDWDKFLYFSEDGVLEGKRKQKIQGMTHHCGLCALSVKGTLVLFDDNFQVYSLTESTLRKQYP